MHIVMTGFGYVVTKAYQLTCRTDMLNLSSTVYVFWKKVSSMIYQFHSFTLTKLILWPDVWFYYPYLTPPSSIEDSVVK